MSEIKDVLKALLEKLDSLLQLGETFSRPYIAIDLFPRGFVNILYMRIRNLGRTPAMDIHIEFDQEFTLRDRSVNEYLIFDHFPVLGSGESLSFLFGSATEILNDEDAVKEFNGRVHYTNIDGIEFEHSFNFNIEIYRNLALVYDYKFEQDIKSEMERLRREIQEISRHYKDLRHKELLERWRGQEEQETESGS